MLRSQIAAWKVKEHARVHLLRIDHIVMGLELKYLIAVKVRGSHQSGSAVCKTRSKKCRFIRRPDNNPSKTKQVGFLDRSGTKLNRVSGSNPDCWQVTRNSC